MTAAVETLDLEPEDLKDVLLELKPIFGVTRDESAYHNVETVGDLEDAILARAALGGERWRALDHHRPGGKSDQPRHAAVFRPTPARHGREFGTLR